MKSRGQKDLDQYIFTRPETARLLNISTNALRMRMKKGRCDLDYRFDGKRFLFKRPHADMVNGPPKTPRKAPTKKLLGTYNRKVQNRINKGATHENHGEDQFVKGNTLNPVSNTIMR